MMRMRLVTGIIYSTVVCMAVGCALTQPPDFSPLSRADRIEIKTGMNQPVKAVTEPAQIKAVAGFIEHYQAGFGIPWLGAPIPKHVLNFYQGNQDLGGFGIGVSFLSAGPMNLLTQEITERERDEVLKLLGLEWSNG